MSNTTPQARNTPTLLPDFDITTSISGTLAFSRWSHLALKVIHGKRTTGIGWLFDLSPYWLRYYFVDILLYIYIYIWAPTISLNELVILTHWWISCQSLPHNMKLLDY